MFSAYQCCSESINLCSDHFRNAYKPGSCLLLQSSCSKEGLTEKSWWSLDLPAGTGWSSQDSGSWPLCRSPAELANSDCTGVVVTLNCQMRVQCKRASAAAHHHECFLHSFLETSVCAGRMRSRQRTLVFWESKLGISSL